MSSSFSRRRFITSAAMTLAAQWAAGQIPFLSNQEKVKHLGLQLWSVRDDMAANAEQTLKALANMGYKEVEGFGFEQGKMFKMQLTDFIKILKNNGLKMHSTHFNLSVQDLNESNGTLSDRAKKALDDLAEAGVRYAICPWIGEADRAQPQKLVSLCQAAGQYAQKAGIGFGYHNHDFEFTTKGADGRMVYEWLLQEVDPALMTLELDLYWVVYAGQNPVEWFRRYPGRFRLCHVKDMAKTPARQTVEVGDGSINFTEIFKERRLAGLEYFIVELEHYATTPMQGVKRARENFRKIRIA
ncbi:MAG: sugar phosphate isomerase/epimerase [Saprospiraceae bacterium]|nr:sugar phosphate isomerase/epimerase [Saprospiraceae bacterium]